MSRTKERLVRSDLLPHVALLAENHLDGPITTEVPPINKNINYWFVGVGVSFNFSEPPKTARNAPRHFFRRRRARRATQPGER